MSFLSIFDGDAKGFDMWRSLWSTVVALVGCAVVSAHFQAMAVEPYGPANAEWTVVVMDPMAAALSCDCVQGYAQRKYERLADYLHEKTGRTVRIVWSESLKKAREEKTGGAVQIVIGKDSVIRHDARVTERDLIPIAQLTDMKGSTQQRGFFVVLQSDPAATLLDIEGYQVLWGPEYCEEKSWAPRNMLKELEIPTSDAETCPTCSIAAKRLLEIGTSSKSVAVISSYAAPLLEGCGTIKKGDLRVIGESDEVPFISVFVDSGVASKDRDALQQALLQMKSKEMLAALETKEGFVPYASEKKSN